MEEILKKLKIFVHNNRQKIIKVVFSVPFIFIAVIVGYVFYVYIVLAPSLVNADFANALPISTKIYDRTGQVLLYEVGGAVQRSIVTEKEIPRILKEATIVSEDKNFYRHFGVDPKAIARAMLANIKAGGIAQGGSTITQQLVKNTYLNSERTVSRKIREAIISLIVESQATKEQILTGYLNNVPYGGNIIGVGKASAVYFGKSPTELTTAQAALLAALPQSPTELSPYNGNKDILQQNRNLILEKLKNKKAISEEEYQLSVAAPIEVLPQTHTIIAPHFTLMVREQLINYFGKDKVEKGGLIVKTSLNTNLQAEVEKALAQHRARIKGWGANNASAVVTDPKSGEILALSGSFDFYDASIDGQVNVAMSPRQPGSSFKPVVYSALFANTAYSPASILYDVKTTFGNWTPKNYCDCHYGPLTIREALAGSVNIPAVKALALVGKDKVLNNALNLGITTLEERRDEFGMSLALGAGEVKLLELTGAFSSFGNEGNLSDTATILSVENNKGKKLFEFKPSSRRVLPEEAAYQINSILSDNSARSFVFGANSPLAFPGRAVAAKTGTTSFYKDAWTVGYTRERAVGVWTGNTDGRIMRYGADGVFVAAPLWRQILQASMKIDNLAYQNFSQPSGVKLVNVNTIKGSRSEYLASWQITDSLSRLAKNSEQPQNPAWEKPVQEYWQKKEEEAKATSPPPEETIPATDVGGGEETTPPPEQATPAPEQDSDKKEHKKNT